MSGQRTLDLDDRNAKLNHSLPSDGESAAPLRVALVTSSYAYIQDGVA